MAFARIGNAHRMRRWPYLTAPKKDKRAPSANHGDKLMNYVPPASAEAASARDEAALAGITRGGAVDIGRALDDGPYTLLQKIAVVLAALSIVVDGFDSQLIG